MSIRRILGAAGSWRTMVLLLVAPAGAYLFLSFGRNPYPAWLGLLLHHPAGIALICALIANLAAMTLRIALDRFQRPPVTPALVRSLDIHAALPLADDLALRQAERLIGEALPDGGIGDRGFRRVSGAWTLLPGAVLRLGIMLMLAGLLVSSHTRDLYETTMHEGEQKELLGSAVAVAKIEAALPADLLQVGDDSTFRLQGLTVRIASGGREHIVTPGLPARFNGLFWRVRHLGFSQPLQITMAGQRTGLTADLDILPPGRTSVVPLPRGDRFLTISLDPEKTITKGLMTGRQYDLTRPFYRVVLQDGGGRAAAAARTKPGGRVRLADADLSLGAPSLFVRLQIVSDPALPFLYAGIVIFLAGAAAMISRFFWYEREIAAAIDGRTMLIGWRDEYFKKWGIHRFQRRMGPGAGGVKD